ncbi:hypothetical protein BIW11_03489 [Tropilaelaps mercedesae]|uniref:Uncharacterized protein n=1 Tax=Tropilaelaps mercedesae TaxID=418985 RepID=A0A1V9XKF2_9ACAR|nr:hypothetical protein BIW11_03489 [Tropilaelaps mercedesae]
MGRGPGRLSADRTVIELKYPQRVVVNSGVVTPPETAVAGAADDLWRPPKLPSARGARGSGGGSRNSSGTCIVTIIAAIATITISTNSATAANASTKTATTLLGALPGPHRWGLRPPPPLPVPPAATLLSYCPRCHAELALHSQLAPPPPPPHLPPPPSHHHSSSTTHHHPTNHHTQLPGLQTGGDCDYEAPNGSHPQDARETRDHRGRDRERAGPSGRGQQPHRSQHRHHQREQSQTRQTGAYPPPPTHNLLNFYHALPPPHASTTVIPTGYYHNMATSPATAVVPGEQKQLRSAAQGSLAMCPLSGEEYRGKRSQVTIEASLDNLETPWTAIAGEPTWMVWHAPPSIRAQSSRWRKDQWNIGALRRFNSGWRGTLAELSTPYGSRGDCGASRKVTSSEIAEPQVNSGQHVVAGVIQDTNTISPSLEHKRLC